MVAEAKKDSESTPKLLLNMTLSTVNLGLEIHLPKTNKEASVKFIFSTLEEYLTTETAYLSTKWHFTIR